MADFFDDEAVVSDNEDEDDLETSEPKRKKKRIISDDEDDGDHLDGDIADLIDDNPDVEENDADSEEDNKNLSDEDSDLDEDDLALINENTGINVKKKKKLSRIRRVQDSDSDDDAERSVDEREQIRQELFDGDEDDDEEPANRRQQASSSYNIDDSGEESDPNDFIVDEDGQPIARGKKKKRRIVHGDAAMQEAQDIFGVDLDFSDLEDIHDEYGSSEDEDFDEDMDDEESHRRKLKKEEKRRKGKKSIYDVFEPSELERGHFTDVDQEIRVTDMPERFQLRRVPVKPAEEPEINEEADWIYNEAFRTASVSNQELVEEDRLLGPDGKPRDPEQCAINMRFILQFMRNANLEVPFINFYRKEHSEETFSINDLWNIYKHDEKFVQLRSRKNNLLQLFKKMQKFQFEQLDSDREKTLDAHVRALTEEDIERVRQVTSLDELRDVYQHFILYYGADIPAMKKVEKEKEKQRLREENGDVVAEEDEEELALKQASRRSGYTICVKNGLAEIARKFGLTPEQFAEHMEKNFPVYDPEQDPAAPEDLAETFIEQNSPRQFKTPAEVLQGARHMVAMQLAHEPGVRKVLRSVFRNRCMISCKPTKKGLKVIDESHPCYTFKFLQNKLVSDLMNDMFLKIKQAKRDGLLEYQLHLDPQASKDMMHPKQYFDEVSSLYRRDEFHMLVEEWNKQRLDAMKRAFEQILYPQMVKELDNKLEEEAKDHVIKSAHKKLNNWVKVGPYRAEQMDDDDDDDYEEKGTRILGIAYSSDMKETGFGALINGEGEMVDFLRLPNIMLGKKSRKDLIELKEEDLKKIKDLVSSKRPHVIAIAGEDSKARFLKEDLKEIVPSSTSVEIVDNELAILFSNTKRAHYEFREYPALLRQAISLARRLQDPMVEFCQMCNPDDDILSLKYHPLQDLVSKEDLLETLNLVFLNRVNEVGVDVNRCVAQPHTAPLVQFLCGLGPRKGYHLLKILKQNPSKLENRTQLVTLCNMGPKVFINCAGFIKIDTDELNKMGTDTYVEVLDGSRIHPETYEWARKMAVDALDYDDTGEDTNPTGALEEILQSPERLKDLDLDAFSVELERQGFGQKKITLYDIRDELNSRYKDFRVPYRSPTSEELFNMLTKETPQTFYIGKLVLCSVTGLKCKAPGPEQTDSANPERDPITGGWICPFCKNNSFTELGGVWSHFDAQECPGNTMGVRTLLDNGVTGIIFNKNVSDKMVTDPAERVYVGMPIHCRIMKIDVERISVDLTSKSSDLLDKEGKWKLNKDAYYDFDTESEMTRKEEEKHQKKARQTYVKRVIAHPSFKNIDFAGCDRLMGNMEQGECIIRPSSKAADHLTITWKVADGIMQHIDIKEQGKQNDFSLGTSLYIGDEEFEDLDEVIARHIQPMAAFARDILSYKYYNEGQGGKRDVLEQLVVDEKRRAPTRIPYFFSASKQLPGKFMLSYMPRKSAKHEFVTVTPDGIRYRGNTHHSLNGLVKWFKEHYRDAMPGSTPSSSMDTPAGRTPGLGTPLGTPMDPTGIQSNSVFDQLTSAAARHTPAAFRTPFSNYQKPSVTPRSSGTPSSTATPRSSSLRNESHTPRTPRERAAQDKMDRAARIGVDWGKEARAYASSSSKRVRTPRTHTPRGGETPGGGATPLMDESRD